MPRLNTYIQTIRSVHLHYKLASFFITVLHVKVHVYIDTKTVASFSYPFPPFLPPRPPPPKPCIRRQTCAYLPIHTYCILSKQHSKDKTWYSKETHTLYIHVIAIYIYMYMPYIEHDHEHDESHPAIIKTISTCQV